MAYFYTISTVDGRVRSSVHECDSMEIGERTYVRTPGVHGWVSRPSDEVFETQRECQFALVSALALAAKRFAEEAGEYLRFER